MLAIGAHRILVAALLASCLLCPALLGAGPLPERTPAGLTLEVSDAELEAGMAYHVLLDDDSQVRVTSRTPLLTTSVDTSRVVGYLVAPFDLEDDEADARPVLTGALRIPLPSLRGGSPYLKGALLGPAGLAAGEHPEVGVLFKGAREVRRIGGKPGDEIFRFAFTADVELVVKGAPVSLEAPVELTYRLSSNETMARYVGDLAVLTSTFELAAEELGIEIPPPLGPIIAPTFTIDLFLVLCTVTPDKSLDPAIPQELFQQEQRFVVLLRDLGYDVAAYAQAESYARSVWDDAAPLGRLAATIVAEPGIERRRLGFARKLAERAAELTKRRDPRLLDTLARIQFETGDAETAIGTQREALELLGDAEDRTRPALQENLGRYEAASKATGETEG